MSVPLSTYPSARNDATEQRWMTMMSRLFTNGVHGATSDTNELRPYADSTGMQVKVDSGATLINGIYGESLTLQTLSLAAAHPTLVRFDQIVARLVTTSPVTIYLDIVTGTPALTPFPPALTNTAPTFEMAIGIVAIAPGVSTITADRVTDARRYVRPATALPPGVPMPFIGQVAPAGFLMLQGQTGLSSVVYPGLAGIINPGGSTFNLPDWRGRVPVGADGAHDTGAMGGALTHSLTEAENGPHSHNITSGEQFITGSWPASTIYSNAGSNVDHSPAYNLSTTHDTNVSGSGTPFSIEQPWVGCNWIIQAF